MFPGCNGHEDADGWTTHCCHHSSADWVLHEKLDRRCKDRILLRYWHLTEHETQGWRLLCSDMASQSSMLLCTGPFWFTWSEMTSSRRCTHPNVSSIPLCWLCPRGALLSAEESGCDSFWLNHLVFRCVKTGDMSTSLRVHSEFPMLIFRQLQLILFFALPKYQIPSASKGNIRCLGDQSHLDFSAWCESIQL